MTKAARFVTLPTAIAPEQAPVAQSQLILQTVSKVESWAEKIRVDLQPDEIRQLITLLKLE